MHNTPLNYTEIHNQKYQNDPVYRARLQYQGHVSDSLVWLMEHQDISQYRVLDYGCGPGRNTISLALQGVHVDAYDPSTIALSDLQHMINQYPETKSLIKVCDQVTDLNQCYDLIVICYVLHFMPIAEAKELMHSLLNRLESGGYICFEYFTPETVGFRSDRYYAHLRDIEQDFLDPQDYVALWSSNAISGDQNNQRIKEMCVFQKK